MGVFRRFRVREIRNGACGRKVHSWQQGNYGKPKPFLPFLIGEIDYGFSNWDWAAPGSGNKGGEFHWAQSYQLLAWGHIAAKSPMDVFNSTELVAPINNIVFRSDHPGGVQFVMLDGSTHFVAEESERRVRNALVTRAGGELE